MTLFTIDSKDNTGSTRQDKPRKIPCANACGWKDEEALHESWRDTSFIPDALDQCVGRKCHSMRILKMWFLFWKQRTSKYITKESVFLEVKCMSHVRLKIKIAPIHYCFLGGTHKATHPLEQGKQHVKFPQAATLQNSPLAQVAGLFFLAQQRQWLIFSKMQWLEPKKPSKWVLTKGLPEKPRLLAAFLSNGNNKKPEVGGPFLYPSSGDISQMTYSFCWGQEVMVFCILDYFFDCSGLLNRVTFLTDCSSLQIVTCYKSDSQFFSNLC